MNKTRALQLLGRKHLPSLAAAIARAKRVVEEAVQVECGTLSPSRSDELAEIYAGRHGRMLEQKIKFPVGYDATLKSFTSYAGAISSTYIKTDDDVIYLWLSDKEVIVGCIV